MADSKLKGAVLKASWTEVIIPVVHGPLTIDVPAGCYELSVVIANGQTCVRAKRLEDDAIDKLLSKESS